MDVIRGKIIKTDFGCDLKYNDDNAQCLRLEFRLENNWNCMLYFKGAKIPFIKKVFDIEDFDELLDVECLLVDNIHVTGVPYGFKPLNYHQEFILNDNVP